MKKEDKLTKAKVIDDVMAIIRPSQVKKNGDDRGAALIQAMLQKARQPSPITSPGRQAQTIRPIPSPPAVQPPPRTIG